jgi:ligand-binding sensor domain-containing protein
MKNQPGNGSMMSFLFTKQGSLLAGAWDDGLYRLDTSYNTVPLNIKPFHEKKTPSVWGMCCSKDSNTIWMASQPGIYRVNVATQSAVFYNPPIMQNKTVRQIAADKFDNLWMGTQSAGLFKWSASNEQIKFEAGVTHFAYVPANAMILKLFIDKAGYVWACTSGYGVYVIDPATDIVVLHFGMKEPADRQLLSDGVASVIQYDDSTIVIAANGLYLFNTTQKKIIKTIPMPESVPASMMAMEKDKDGYLWISMTQGLFRVNPRNKIFIHFDRIDGIITASFTLPLM